MHTTAQKTKRRAHPRDRPELSDEQKQEIKEAFDHFDANKDGSTDYHELKVTMRALGFDLKKAEVLKLLRDHDKTGHNLIEYEHFAKVGKHCIDNLTNGPNANIHETMAEWILARDPAGKIKRAFQLFDDDKTGRISLEILNASCES